MLKYKTKRNKVAVALSTIRATLASDRFSQDLLIQETQCLVAATRNTIAQDKFCNKVQGISQTSLAVVYNSKYLFFSAGQIFAQLEENNQVRCLGRFFY